MRGQGAGPGDIAVTGRVIGIVTFHKNPTVTLEDFTEGKEVGGNVLMAFGKALPGGGELVHEGQAEIMLLAGEVDTCEYRGKATLRSFLTERSAICRVHYRERYGTAKRVRE